MNETNTTSTTWSASELLYLKYYGAGFSGSLAGFYFLPFLLTIVAFILHGSLVYVTVKCKLYRLGLFGLLIALDSGVSVLFLTCFNYPFWLALFGLNFVPALTCFLLQIPSLFGVIVQHMAMLFIGIERLLCIVFPIWVYKKHYKRIQYTIALMLGSSTSFALYLNIALYQSAVTELNDKKVMCYSRGDIVVPWILSIYFRYLMSVECCTTGCYLLIWLLMFRAYRNNSTLTTLNNMYILRALSVHMALIMFGWMLNTLSPYFWPYLPLDSAESILAARTVLTMITVINSASNAPMLYIFSIEYRRHYKKNFKFLNKGSVTVVEPFGTVNGNNGPITNVPPMNNFVGGVE